MPDDGDDETAASVGGAFQALANRTTFLKTALDAGATKVRTVASLAALRALTAHEHGDLVALAGSGLFVFHSGSTRLDDSKTTVRPTNAAGPGRWLSPIVALLEDGGTISGPLTTGLLTAGNTSLGGTKCQSLTVEVTPGGVPGFIECGMVLAHSQIDAEDGIHIKAPSTLTAPLTPSGAGRVRKRTVLGKDSDATYKIADADVVICTSSLLSAARTYTLSNDGAATGDQIQFVNRSNSHYLTVSTAGGGDTALINLSAHRNATTFTFMSSSWHETDVSSLP